MSYIKRRCSSRYGQRVADDDHKPLGPGVEFSIADYNAARADCLQGLIGQQSILTWSIAAIGVVFAAGLSVSPHIRDPDTIRHWVFFLGIPLLTLGASIAWLGEIFRMERDAHYMRLLEKSTWTDARLRDKYDKTEKIEDDDVGYPTLLLNTWVAHSEPEGRNRVVGYVGGILIYLGATACSLALGCALVHENRTLAIALSAAWIVIYIVLTVAQLRRILNFSKLSPGQATKRVVSSGPRNL